MRVTRAIRVIRVGEVRVFAGRWSTLTTAASNFSTAGTDSDHCCYHWRPQVREAHDVATRELRGKKPKAGRDGKLGVVLEKLDDANWAGSPRAREYHNLPLRFPRFPRDLSLSHTSLASLIASTPSGAP
jgi:hypothetical protein